MPILFLEIREQNALDTLSRLGLAKRALVNLAFVFTFANILHKSCTPLF